MFPDQMIIDERIIMKKLLSLLLLFSLCLLCACNEGNSVSDNASQVIAKKMTVASANATEQPRNEDQTDNDKNVSSDKTDGFTFNIPDNTPDSSQGGATKLPEPTLEPEPTVEPIPTEEPAQPQELYRLTLDDLDCEFNEYASSWYGDGYYIDTYIYDSMVSVSFARLEPSNSNKDALTAVLTVVKANENADEAVTADMYLADHEAYLFEFTSGANEDTRLGSGVYFNTDDALYVFFTKTPIDWSEDYSYTIEGFIQSLYFTEWDGSNILGTLE